MDNYYKKKKNNNNAYDINNNRNNNCPLIRGINSVLSEIMHTLLLNSFTPLRM